MTNNKLWAISNTFALVLAVVLFGMWKRMDNYIVEADSQLVDEEYTDRYLRENFGGEVELDETRRIKTGIFIQSLKFFNSSEVNFTGYIWQHFNQDVYENTPDSEIKPSFILPEQVQTGADIAPKIVYRMASDYGEVIGWYVEATLKQEFDYSRYPFDHKTVWVRLWPREFSENVILNPDFNAYESTGLDAIFGIEKSIVLGAWKRTNTYFDYKSSSYDTNFGIPNYIGQHGFPELYYNFVIKRRFDNAFIVYLLPLFLVAVLLFAAMLTITGCKDRKDLLGFSASGFLGMCSALFFVVMIAHIQLREQFAGAKVVYLEYFYILMYVLLVGGTINTYLFSMRPKAIKKLVLYRDNIIPKLCYWPFVFASLCLLTLGFS